MAIERAVSRLLMADEAGQRLGLAPRSLLDRRFRLRTGLQARRIGRLRQSASASVPTSPSGHPAHQLLLGAGAQRDLDRLTGETWTKVKDTLINLTHIPRPKGCVKLRAGAWRIRVGDIRVLYDIDDKAKTVEVLRIGHRRDIYRRVWRAGAH